MALLRDTVRENPMPRTGFLLQMLQMLQKFCNKKGGHFGLLFQKQAHFVLLLSLLQMLQRIYYSVLKIEKKKKYWRNKNGVTFVTIVTNGGSQA